MIFTLTEIIDAVLMTLLIGFIFSDVFKKPTKIRDIVDVYAHKTMGIDWNNVKFAALVTAPAIILHELGHKFMAIYFGMNASFHAAYGWLFLALLLKLMNFGFIFLVPAYVSILGNGTDLQFSLVAFAGPFVNLVLWLGSYLILKQKKLKRKYIHALTLTRQINMFLFIFNMLPIPGFDGFSVFSHLLHIII